jgi:ABC-type multidrug transport system fused ATPase/permease subunit
MSLCSVFFAVAFASLSLGQATSFIPEFLKARLSAAFLFKIIDEESTVDSLDRDGEKPYIKGRITFKNVTFSYPLRPDFKVLQGVNLEVPEGVTLGIGESISKCLSTWHTLK